MLQKIKTLIITIPVMISFLAALAVQASTITSDDGNTSFRFAGESEIVTVDQFIAATTITELTYEEVVESSESSEGDSEEELLTGVIAKDFRYISYNSFTDFIVNEPLRIFNLESSDKPAADLVIIHADQVVLESSIEVIGPKTDVLIVERTSNVAGDGIFYCNGCEFLNMNRITLTALQDGVGIDFSRVMSKVGELNPSSVSKGIINKLHAPGALSLELLFSKVANDDLININHSSDGSGVGVYETDINGNRTIGLGTVNIFLGQYQWNYEKREFLGVANESGEELSVGGRIEAQNVRILSTYPLTVNTDIDTRTDMLSTAMYRGNLTIVDENVTVETVKASTASLNLVGNIDTEGSVNLNSAHDMSVSSYSKVNSALTNIVVANSFYNFGSIKSATTYIDAGSIANEGKILSKTKAEISASDYIFNQYGGVIQSEDIMLTSESGIVRNGSKTPYKDISPSTNTLISYSDNYIDELNATQLGAFYQSNVNTWSDNLVLAPVASASIFGNKVQIVGAAFENINPYYVFTKDDGSIVIDTEKAMQVRLSADEKLMVITDNYILNSSAIMEMNNSEGKLTLKAPLVNNERYRVHSTLVYSSESTSTSSYSSITSTTTNESLAAEVAVYSLPALILSMGDVRIDAVQSVLNNTAYMEIFGDLYINSPTVSSLGYELGILESNSTFTSSAWHRRYNNIGGIFKELALIALNNLANQEALESNSINAEIDSELETLFFVDGDIKAAQATGWFSNNLPLYKFAADRASELFDEYENRCYTGDVFAYEEQDDDWDYRVNHKRLCTESTPEEDRFYLDSTHTVEINEETNELLVHRSHDNIDANCFSSDCGRTSGEIHEYHVDFTRSYDLFDWIKDYYDSAVDWLAEVYEEIRFW